MSKTSEIFQKLSGFCFGLLLIDMIIDPTNLYFKLKFPLFLLFFLLFFFNIRTTSAAVMSILIYFFVIIYSTFLMMLIRRSYDSANNLTYFTSGVSILLLLFINSGIQILKPLYIGTSLISFITIIIFIFGLFFPALSELMAANNFVVNNYIIQRRGYFGVPITMIFHKSSPLIVFSFSFSMMEYLVHRRPAMLYLSFLYAITLLISGTRANILSLLLLFLFLLGYFLLYKKKRINALGQALSVSSFFIGLLIILLVFVEVDHSMEIKSGHISSIIELFVNEPRLFLTGMGPGSLFYTKGFNREVVLTEVTYLEMFRMFGIPGALMLLWIYLFPLIILLFIKKRIICFITVLSYLFIAGTNPLLFGNAGFIALFISYWMIQNPVFLEE